MKGFLPGTVIEADVAEFDGVCLLIDGIFSAGGLVLSQVARLTGVEPHGVQNWVKRGFCSPPVGKQYSKRKFFRIVTINMLKECLSLTQISGLLSIINGRLNSEDDDMIGDDLLYLYFLRIMSLTERENINEASVTAALKTALANYTEPYTGGKKRLEKVLRVMVYAYYSSELQKKALTILSSVD